MRRAGRPLPMRPPVAYGGAMTLPPIARLAALAAACALLATSVHGEIFKCAGTRGRPVFQDSPCDGSVKRSIAPEKPVELDPRWAADAPEEDRRAIGLLQSYQKCTHALPAVGYAVAMDYQRWRSEHSAMLARLERQPAFQAAMRSAAEEGDRARGKLTEQQRAATAEGCAPLEYLFAPPGRTLSEVKAELDRDAPAACEEIARDYRMSHLDPASAQYQALQREAAQGTTAEIEQRRDRLERKLQSLPPSEREDARKHRESLQLECAKREGLAGYKPH